MFLTLLCTDIADVFISTSFVVVTSAAKGSSLGKKAIIPNILSRISLSVKKGVHA